MPRGVARKGQGKGKAKRTGPSKRTAAERAAIDKRAAHASKMAKRKQRAEQKGARKVLPAAVLTAGSPLSFYCPTCRAKSGKPCIGAGLAKGDFHRARAALKVADIGKAKPQPLAKALAPLVAETGGNKGKATGRQTIDAQRLKTFGVSHYSPHAELIDPKLIVVGERHRKDFGDLKALAQSIDDRGGLIQPIAVKPPYSKPVLIAGERRLRAWALSRFAGQPIPAHFLDVDSIIAGEWDENAQRKDFTHSEAVKIQRALESVHARLKASRPTTEKPARGRKASGEAAGRVKDKVGNLTGIGRESLRKAGEVVEAAERDQERYGDLVEQMDRSGKVNAAHKKLKVREAKAAIAAAPPPLPMNLKECGTVVIDFPHAGEPDQDQEKLDAAGRAFRPYPEMSIKSCCQFASDEIAPQLAEKVSVWLLVTNFILVRGYHMHLIAALGFKPENAATMLTWGKDKIGRGKILRDQTEHAILLTRGSPLIDVFGENPPSTLLLAPRRENSRKPDEFWRLVERVTPAKRYASIFSQGGEGENWDGHGDQVGKFAQAPIVTEPEVLAAAAAQAPDLPTAELVNLELLADGQEIRPDLVAGLRKSGFVSGRKELRLTKAGLDRLSELRQAVDVTARAAYEAASVKPQQVDLEDAIAAFENADLYRIPQDLIDAIVKRGGHTFSRTIDHDAGEKGFSVATCQCGVTFRADRTLPYSGENAIAPLEEKHWREVLAQAAAPAPGGNDYPEFPPELRRRPAEAA